MKIAETDDVQPGQSRRFEVVVKKTADVDGIVYADDTCTHVHIGVGRFPRDIAGLWRGAYECR